jgi:hypothetical protein
VGLTSLPRAPKEDPGLLELLVLDDVAVLVLEMSGDHDGRPYSRRRPVRVNALEKNDDAADVRRRHRRPGHEGERLRTQRGRRGAKDVEARGNDVRLQNVVIVTAGASAGEGGDDGRAAAAELRALGVVLERAANGGGLLQDGAMEAP